MPFIYDNIPEIAKFLDPDGILSLFSSALDMERLTQSDTIQFLLNLFDPDVCPETYLPYLAAQVGCPYYAEDPLSNRRAYIRSAVQRYKIKGLESSFVLLMRSLGWDITVFPLWFDKAGTVVRDNELTDAQKGSDTWRPHARIDIEVTDMGGSSVEILGVDPNELLARLEEVRPIHVLIRGIFYGLRFIEAVTARTDSLTGVCDILLKEYVDRIGTSPCLTYFGTSPQYGRARPDRRYNRTFQFYYGWQMRFTGGGTPLNPNTSYPYQDPSHPGQPATYGDYLGYGTLVTYGQGWVLKYDGTHGVLFNGGSDTAGRPYLYDLKAHDYDYDYSCPIGLSADRLTVDLTVNLQDKMGRLTFYDGASLPGYSNLLVDGQYQFFYDGTAPRFDVLSVGTSDQQETDSDTTNSYTDYVPARVDSLTITVDGEAGSDTRSTPSDDVSGEVVGDFSENPTRSDSLTLDLGFALPLVDSGS